LIAAIALPAAIALASSAIAQSENAQSFANKAAESDLFEIATGELAVKNSKDPQVKELGQMMVADHGKSSQMLKEIATAQGLTLPTELNKAHEATLQTLQNAGDDIDAPYVQAQDEAHRDAISLFETYASTGDNPELQKFAQDTLPTLKKHLEEVQAARQGLGTAQ